MLLKLAIAVCPEEELVDLSLVAPAVVAVVVVAENPSGSIR